MNELHGMILLTSGREIVSIDWDSARVQAQKVDGDTKEFDEKSSLDLEKKEEGTAGMRDWVHGNWVEY